MPQNSWLIAPCSVLLTPAWHHGAKNPKRSRAVPMQFPSSSHAVPKQFPSSSQTVCYQILLKDTPFPRGNRKARGAEKLPQQLPIPTTVNTKATRQCTITQKTYSYSAPAARLLRSYSNPTTVLLPSYWVPTGVLLESCFRHAPQNPAISRGKRQMHIDKESRKKNSGRRRQEQGRRKAEAGGQKSGARGRRMECLIPHPTRLTSYPSPLPAPKGSATLWPKEGGIRGHEGSSQRLCRQCFTSIRPSRNMGQKT
jgi:hypothetical protein